MPHVINFIIRNTEVGRTFLLQKFAIIIVVTFGILKDAAQAFEFQNLK